MARLRKKSTTRNDAGRPRRRHGEHGKRRAEGGRDARSTDLARYVLFFEQQPDPGYMVSPDGKILDVNKAAATFLGKSRDELIGKKVVPTVYPRGSRGRARELFETWKRSGRLCNEEIVVEDRRGNPHTMLLNVGSLKDEKGKTVCSVSIQKDVSELKRTQELCREQRDRAESYLELAGSMMVALDSRGRIRLLNRAACEVLGVDPDNMRGKSWFANCIPQRNRKQVRGVFGRLAEGNTTSVEYGENPVLTASGEERIIAWHNTILFEKDGSFGGTLSSGMDITERRRAEEAHRASEASLRGIFDGVDDLIVVHDPRTGRTLDVNRRVEEAFGCSKDEFLDTRIADWAVENDEDTHAKALPLIRSAARGKQVRVEWQCRAKTGRTFWIESNLRRAELRGKRVVLAVGRDITERKRMEEERRRLTGELGSTVEQLRAANQQLRAGEQQLKAANQQLRGNEQQLRAMNQQLEAHQQQLRGANEQLKTEIDFSRRLIDKAAEGIVVCHDIEEFPFLEFSIWNKRMTEISGYTMEEINRRGWYQTVYPDPEYQAEAAARMARMREGEDLVQEEWTITRSDGTERIVTISTSVLPGHDGKVHVLGMMQDITERKAAERELQKAERLESLGVLAGGIAHDFNNLLGGVFGYIDMASEASRPGSDSARYLEKAMGGFHRAKALTQQLLTFSKGGAPIRRPVALEDIVRNACGLALSGSNLRPRYQVEEGLWGVEADEGQIGQVVGNMVINARHATPEGGELVVTLSNARVDGGESLPLPPGDYLKLTIADHGTGIAPEHMRRIFDPFFSTKQEGSGLGLATAFSIVQRHGGHIGVDSRLGEGTSFTVYLPADPALMSTRTEEKGNVFKGTGRVLVMDDEVVVREMAVDALQALGYEAVTVGDGEEAIATYRRCRTSETDAPFDAVILDLTVPGGMGGLEAGRELRKIDPSVKTIVSSGYAEDPVLAAPKTHGFNGAIRKPYLVRELGEELYRVLSQKIS